MQPASELWRSRRWGCFASIQLAEERGFRAWVLREAVRLRTRWRHMPYGDQALFVQRDLFWCARFPGFRLAAIILLSSIIQQDWKRAPVLYITHPTLSLLQRIPCVLIAKKPRHLISFSNDLHCPAVDDILA